MARPVIERSSTVLRQEIAARAARLIAEDHIHDFALAKRKAARQMGVAEGRALPSNQEIEEALMQYRAVYDPEHGDLLLEFRRKAVFLMRFLGKFRPYLAGSVLSGVAGPHSNINLILFHDDPKTVEFFLLDQKIDYEHKETTGMQRYAGFPSLAFWYDDTPVLLHVRPLTAERSTNNREERATLTEVERLIGDTAAK